MRVRSIITFLAIAGIAADAAYAAPYAIIDGVYADYNRHVVIAIPAATKQLATKCGPKFQSPLPPQRDAEIARLAASRLLSQHPSRSGRDNIDLVFVSSPSESDPPYLPEQIKQRLSGSTIDRVEPMLLEAGVSWVLVWFKQANSHHNGLLPAVAEVVNGKVMQITFNDAGFVPITYNLNGCTNG